MSSEGGIKNVRGLPNTGSRHPFEDWVYCYINNVGIRKSVSVIVFPSEN